MYIDSAVCASSTVDGCGPIGLIVSYKDTVCVLYINAIKLNLTIYKINTFGVVCISGAIMFVILLVEFLSVIGVLGVIVACISCGGVGVELASSLQCLNLRGADVSTRSTSDPDDSLSHSEHCLENCNVEKF